MYITLSLIHISPEAELRVEQDRRAVAREDAVEDHRPDVAEHDAADEVRHEEHRAVQVLSLIHI